MSSNILAVVMFSVSFFIMTNEYAYAECQGTDCYCTFPVYDKPSKGFWTSRCYTPWNKEIGYGMANTSVGAMADCLVKCLRYDQHTANSFSKNPTSPGARKVIKNDPHVSPTVLDKKHKKS